MSQQRRTSGLRKNSGSGHRELGESDRLPPPFVKIKRDSCGGRVEVVPMPRWPMVVVGLAALSLGACILLVFDESLELLVVLAGAAMPLWWLVPLIVDGSSNVGETLVKWDSSLETIEGSGIPSIPYVEVVSFRVERKWIRICNEICRVSHLYAVCKNHRQVLIHRCGKRSLRPTISRRTRSGR